MHTKSYKVMNELPILVLLKFTRFLPRIKAKTLSSICTFPKEQHKYKKCFSFIGGVLRIKTGVGLFLYAFELTCDDIRLVAVYACRIQVPPASETSCYMDLVSLLQQG